MFLSYTKIFLLLFLVVSAFTIDSDLLAQNQQNNTFYLHENGVTVICDEAEVSESGEVNGITYTKRERDQITVDNAATTCTSGITDMSFLFNLKNDFNEDISSWDVSSVTNMTAMFSGWDYLNETAKTRHQIIRKEERKTKSSGHIIGKRSQLTNENTHQFNQDISAWDVSNVTNMTFMFDGAAFFDQAIGNWNVSKVDTMWGVFYDASSFNQPIGDWDVSNVVDMDQLFYGATNFNQPIGSWDVSNVELMWGVFYDASSFNQPIGDWDVSNVVDMDQLFYGATNFNQPIGSWDVSNVVNMNQMFHKATAFDQNLGRWDVSNTTVFDTIQMLSDGQEINTFFADSAGFSTDNYDAILQGWSQLDLVDSLSITFGDVQYSQAAAAARQKIIDDHGWTINDGGLATGTSVDELLPIEYTLNQNYPNPFNPSTQINYSLAKAGLANLEVFNLQGQKVAELVNQVQTAGTYSITFDAANLPSGVYLYRLSTPDGQLMRKMSLIK